MTLKAITLAQSPARPGHASHFDGHLGILASQVTAGSIASGFGSDDLDDLDGKWALSEHQNVKIRFPSRSLKLELASLWGFGWQSTETGCEKPATELPRTRTFVKVPSQQPQALPAQATSPCSLDFHPPVESKASELGFLQRMMREPLTD